MPINNLTHFSWKSSFTLISCSVLTFFLCLGRHVCLQAGRRFPGPPGVCDGSCVSVFRPGSRQVSAAGWFQSSSFAFLGMPVDTFTKLTSEYSGTMQVDLQHLILGAWKEMSHQKEEKKKEEKKKMVTYNYNIVKICSYTSLALTQSPSKQNCLYLYHLFTATNICLQLWK